MYKVYIFAVYMLMVYQKVVRTALTLDQEGRDGPSSTKTSLIFLYDTIVVDTMCGDPSHRELVLFYHE
jgi:hypothetical protein